MRRESHVRFWEPGRGSPRPLTRLPPGHSPEARGGARYPRSVGELRSWFGTDAACLDYLGWIRWRNGFVCDKCGHNEGWRLSDGRIECAACSRRTSVTAGTIFDRTRTPLTVWFAACWEFTTAKDGVSALSLQRTLEIDSYQTAWTMLHRLRSVLVRLGRDRLSGTVEVDETYSGGGEPGLRGGRQKGKKILVCVAVELREPHGLGRCRMGVLHDGSADSLMPFVTENIEEGTTVITDGWPSYNGVVGLGYVHEPRSQRAAKARGEDVGALLSGVHRVASLSKRWLAGTHQGRLDPGHLPGYLTSSCSDSIAGAPRAGDFSSSGSLSSLSTTISSATTTSRSADDLARSCRHPHRSAGTRPASTGSRPIVHGGSPTGETPVRWRTL